MSGQLEKAFATALGERKLDASITRTEASAAIMVTTVSTPAILSDGGPGANAASFARNLRAVNLSPKTQRAPNTRRPGAPWE